MVECDQLTKHLEELTGVGLPGASKMVKSTVIQDILELVPERETNKAERPSSNVPSEDLKEITHDEVSCHDQLNDCWIILYDRVYDVTKFLQEHPGGTDVILEYAGRDATLAFRGFGHSSHAWQMVQRFLIGAIPESEKSRIFNQREREIDFQLRAIS